MCRLSQDGLPVVIHDATLVRTGLTDGVVAELLCRGAGENRRRYLVQPRSNGQEKISRMKTSEPARVFELFADTGDSVLYLELKSTAATERGGRRNCDRESSDTHSRHGLFPALIFH